ncbi:hypothetical protein ACQPZJ_28740 [Actinoplanes sp. CA-054009]
MFSFSWLQDHFKATVATFLVTVVGVVIAALALINDRFGGGGDGGAEAATPPPSAVVTSVPVTESPSVEPTTEAPSVSPEVTGEVESPEPSETTEAPAAPEVTYLDEVDDTDRNGGFRREAVTMNGTNYQRSVQFTCNGKQTYFVFPVAGYRALSFSLGIDDATADASGLAADVTFYSNTGRQIGAKKYTAVLGPAKKVTVDVNGVVQLKIRCYGRDAETNQQRSIPYVAFGEAVLTR